MTVMNIGIGDSIEYWDFCNYVYQGMDFNTRLGTSKMSPVKHGHTQIYRRRVYCIELAVKTKLLNNPFFLCKRNHMESKVFKDMVISDFICSRQGRLVNWSFAKSEVIGSFSMCNSNIRKFTKTPASKELTKHQNQQLAPMRKRPSLCSVVILCNQSSEISLWQVRSKLRKNMSYIVKHLGRGYVCTGKGRKQASHGIQG